MAISIDRLYESVRVLYINYPTTVDILDEGSLWIAAKDENSL